MQALSAKSALRRVTVYALFAGGTFLRSATLNGRFNALDSKGDHDGGAENEQNDIDENVAVSHGASLVADHRLSLSRAIVALTAVALTGCASHPILRDALIATAVASVAASHSHDTNDGRKYLPPNPCTPDPARCK